MHLPRDEQLSDVFLGLFMQMPLLHLKLGFFPHHAQLSTQ
jgi:hypothetical protein